MAEIIYPYKKYNYKVLIDQMEEAGFSEVVAPDISADPVEYREGNIGGKVPARQPGILKHSNITLKHGTTQSHIFVDWIKAIKDNKVLCKTVVITLMDDKMKEVASWQLENVWPTKYTATDFNDISNEAAIESLELVYENITRIK